MKWDTMKGITNLIYLLVIVIIGLSVAFLLFGSGLLSAMPVVPVGAIRESQTSVWNTNEMETCKSTSGVLIVSTEKPIQKVLWGEYEISGSSSREHDQNGITLTMRYGSTDLYGIASNRQGTVGYIEDDQGIFIISAETNCGRTGTAWGKIRLTNVVYFPVEETTTITPVATGGGTVIEPTSIWDYWWAFLIILLILVFVIIMLLKR